MSKNKNQIMGAKPGRRVTMAVTSTALVIAAAAVIGCGPAKEGVCQGVAENLVLVPSTSVSDLETDRALAPKVAEQVVARAADSCGSVTVGLQNNRTAADLELVTLELRPDNDEAFNRTPVVRDMVKDGTEFAEEHLLEPLSKVPATKGSPFLGALAKIGEELDVHDLAPAKIILLGDGIDVEVAPSGKGDIDFTDKSTDPALVQEFVPLLKPLKGSCVMLLGAGADSKLPDSLIREAQAMLGKTIEERRGGVRRHAVAGSAGFLRMTDPRGTTAHASPAAWAALAFPY